MDPRDLFSERRDGSKRRCRLILAGALLWALTYVAFSEPTYGDATVQLPKKMETALTHLTDLCSPEKDGPVLDLELVSQIADFVRNAPEWGTGTPQDRDQVKGSFIIYNIRRSLPEIIRYAYNRRIPGGAINPSSVDHSFWKELPSGCKVLPDVWKALDDLDKPLIARGVMREAISPDLHTGAYYEYDLERAFILFRQGTMRVVVSLSSQIGDSEVGRKGFIVGDDQDWNYLYTQDRGLDVRGLGWLRSRIYTFSSVCLYIEDTAHPGNVRVGAFQWLGAGAVGMNLVDSHHIRKGMERYAEQFKEMMESEHMPDPETLENVHAALEKTPEDLLREKALDVTLYIKRKAQQDESLMGKSAIRELDAAAYVGQMKKQRLISILMREFVKFSLGKDSALKPDFWLAFKKSAASAEQPLS